MTIANHGQRAELDAASLYELKRLAANLLAYSALCLLMLTLRPFNYVSIIDLKPEQGDTLNQVGYLIAGTISTIALATLVNHRLLRIFLSPSWIGIAIVLAISVAVAPDPTVAVRSVVLTVICILIASCIVLLPPDEGSFQRVCAAAILTVLAISYSGILLWPDLSIHGSGGSEAQHAGLWRGHFAHKNAAGPVLSVFVMFGIYLLRSGFRGIGAAIAVLSFVFVIQTGSKTTNGLLPISIMVVLAGRLFALPLLTILLYAIAVLAVAMLTIGTVYSPTLSEITAAVLSDPSFTGRVTLWEYGIENIPNELWFGTGFDSFWGTPVVTDIENPYEWQWDFRGIVHGHNNFIDMALTTGLIGFVVLLWALFIAPAVNYVRSNRFDSNRNLADLFMMILVFLTLLSFLETFFLRRMDPIWLTMVIAIVGLQLTSRYKTR
ncbi:MAG: O-antigen ligase family protein [Hyphomicrobiales bacterium]|nr:O-antigen ligase family protein [Hyphomicrobiales bacterium]MCP4998467.1 O-antigen ligase family protein [Hyphomicrobiales bacterium]